MSAPAKELPKTLPRWDIPSDWRWVSLADVGKVITGNTPPTKVAENYGSDIPFVKPPELVDRGIAGATEGLSQIGMKTARLLPKGAVLVSCIGGLGKTGLAKVPMAFNQQINAIVFDERVVPEYGFYYAQTLKPWLYGVASATTLPIVNKGKFQRAPFPLAPRDQQENIVAEIEKQFSRLDEAVANLKRVKANLKRYKAAVLKAAVEGKLTEEWRKSHPDVEPASKLLNRILAERRAKWEEAELAKMEAKGKAPKNDKWKAKYKEPIAPDVSNLPKLPAGWVWTTTEQLTWLITSGSRGWGKYYSDEGVLFIRAQDIKTDNLNLRGVARVAIPAEAEGVRSSVSSQDILVTITGANVTKSALVPRMDEVAFVSQHVALLKMNLPETAPFIFDWIVSPANGRKTLETWAYGAGKPGLNLEQVRSLPIALPPLSEQCHISTEVDRHLSLIRETEGQVDANVKRAERLRQSILSRAFSGAFADRCGNPSPAKECA